MFLIADSGSTKTTWSLMGHTTEILRFETEGYNPYFVSSEYIIKSLGLSLNKRINKSEIKVIYFYGAGCVSDRKSVIIRALKTVFKVAEIFVYPDLLAVARGLLHDQPGFVAILGTGSNTGLYNGDRIELNIDSLGYILGDEGSSSYLGKKVLQDFLRGKMPKDVNTRFNELYNITKDEIFRNVYTQPLANRYCAQYSKFLKSGCDYSNNLVKAAFRVFFENLVTLYPNYEQYTFNCIGSIAYVFKKSLEETANEFNMKTNKVLQSPMSGLIKYHYEHIDD